MPRISTLRSASSRVGEDVKHDENARARALRYWGPA